MTDPQKRPPDLPDFRLPPLNEVVVGVQFAAPQGYQQIRAGEVWGVFKDEYPQVQEHQALAPAFETFGLPFQHSSLMPQFGIVTGGVHDRFWFLKPEGDELLQFQQDRLLHNWRKVGGGENNYPRFEAMRDGFCRELFKLQEYFASLVPQSLMINQCEISYINHIPFDRADERGFSYWLSFLSFGQKSPDDFTVNFREVVRSPDGRPIGRLYVESSLGYLQNGREVIVLSLTVKGAPEGADIGAAMNFLSVGRDVIVRRFVDLTSAEAHRVWGRVQ